MKLIPILKNKIIVSHCMVDDEDFEWLNQFKWYLHAGYATRVEWHYELDDFNNKKRVSKQIRMHNIIFSKYSDSFSGKVLDHKDRNKLNNQKSNLRKATFSENVLNRPKAKNNTSGFIGVKIDERRKLGHYLSFSTDPKIKHGLSRQVYIGTFPTARLAALARDMHMRKFYSAEFVNFNISDPSIDEINLVNSILSEAKKVPGKSKFRGVWLHKNKWVAEIIKNGKKYRLGRFADEAEAALAYNKKALELYGEKAKLNKI